MMKSSVCVAVALLGLCAAAPVDVNNEEMTKRMLDIQELEEIAAILHGGNKGEENYFEIGFVVLLLFGILQCQE